MRHILHPRIVPRSQTLTPALRVRDWLRETTARSGHKSHRPCGYDALTLDAGTVSRHQPLSSKHVQGSVVEGGTRIPSAGWGRSSQRNEVPGEGLSQGDSEKGGEKKSRQNECHLSSRLIQSCVCDCSSNNDRLCCLRPL